MFDLYNPTRIFFVRFFKPKLHRKASEIIETSQRIYSEIYEISRV
jgi:hypothetical protein